MKNVLKIENLKKTYEMGKGNEVDVLKNVDLHIDDGEFVTIMGPSGSGKSTLLYNISGMDRMTGGEVVFDGKSLNTFSEKDLTNLRLREMGFVFQDKNLLKNLSIFENIILSSYLDSKNDRENVNAKGKELMAQMGISELKDNEITQVSGGELQRAAICRALINSPKIIFGDEPTGALNSSATEDVMKTFSEINNEGTTLVIATHDVKVAAWSERVIFMMDGLIVDEYNHGKYDASTEDLGDREDRLMKWLVERGF